MEREKQKRMEQQRREWKNRRVQELKAKHKEEMENLFYLDCRLATDTEGSCRPQQQGHV